MSIPSSHSPVFLQRSLPPMQIIEEEHVIAEGIVYQWHVNECVVYLMKEHNSLKYRTTDRDGRELYTHCIAIPASKTLAEMLYHLKKCQAMVDENGVARFLTTYHTWKNSHREIYRNLENPYPWEKDFITWNQKWEYDPTIQVSLNRGSGELIWNLFRRFSKKNSSFHSFQEATIPSSRCHPETISLIEKIKREAFNDRELLYCLIKDFSVRVIDPETLKKELEIEKNNVKIECFSDQCDQETFLIQDKKTTYSLAAGTAYLSRNAIVSAASAVSRFLGGGILGKVSGAYAGLFVAGFGAITAVCGAQAVASHFFPYSLPDALRKKQEALKERACFVSIESSAFIEIEPISALSEIDPRMRVSKLTWAVTIVNGISGPSSNHTAILVEGLANEYFQGSVPDGEYFIHKSEFNPPITSHLYSLRVLKMYIAQGLRRTEIWMKPSKQVIVMLQEINRQQLLHQEKLARGEQIKWSVAGSDSWWSGGLDNCFTWTRKSVALLDITLGKNFHSQMFAWPRAFTKPFKQQEKNRFLTPDIKI